MKKYIFLLLIGIICMNGCAAMMLGPGPEQTVTRANSITTTIVADFIKTQDAVWQMLKRKPRVPDYSGMTIELEAMLNRASGNHYSESKSFQTIVPGKVNQKTHVNGETPYEFYSKDGKVFIRTPQGEFVIGRDGKVRKRPGPFEEELINEDDK